MIKAVAYEPLTVRELFVNIEIIPKRGDGTWKNLRFVSKMISKIYRFSVESIQEIVGSIICDHLKKMNRWFIYLLTQCDFFGTVSTCEISR